MQQPPGYYRDQQQPPPPAPREPLAAWSVWISGIGVLTYFCFGFVLCIVGTVLGVISLVNLRRRPYLEGQTTAWAGTLLGAIPTAIYFVLLGLALSKM